MRGREQILRASPRAGPEVPVYGDYHVKCSVRGGIDRVGRCGVADPTRAREYLAISAGDPRASAYRAVRI